MSVAALLPRNSQDITCITCSNNQRYFVNYGWSVMVISETCKIGAH